MFKKRPNGGRKWVICFALVFCLSKAIDSGAGSVTYLFYRLQFKINNSDYANLSTVFTILMFISQVSKTETRNISNSIIYPGCPGPHDEQRTQVERHHHHHHCCHRCHLWSVCHRPHHPDVGPLHCLCPLHVVEHNHHNIKVSSF